MTGLRSRPRRSLLVIGPFPPPVHGMAVVTREIVRAIERRGTVRVRIEDTSPGSLSRNLAYHAGKIRRVAAAVVSILRRDEFGTRLVYLPVDAGWGMAYTVLLVALARARGFRVTLHHHSAAYLGQPRAAARALNAVAGKRTAQVMICPAMRDRYAGLYGSRGARLTLSNAFLVPRQAERPERGAGPIRIGHFGNLSAGKGLDLAIETFAGLVDAGIPARFVLAGPAVGRHAQRQIDAAARRFGDDIEYLGSLRGEQKHRFFGGIDLFLFPSRHREIQGIVNLEAMSYGVVPIAFGHGCIPSDFAEGGGVVIDPGDDFPTAAVELLARWSRRPEELLGARRRSYSRFDELKRQADEQLRQLIDWLDGGTADSIAGN
jgi:glycosyltransferase involved in cell wall biosynthesis